MAETRLYKWFERSFPTDLPLWHFPVLVERLRGTPVRLAVRTQGLSRSLRTGGADNVWSIQENVGHLLDLEPLWAGRLDDLQNDAQTLRPADLTNRRTHGARHDDAVLQELLTGFRSEREQLVSRLDRTTPEFLERRALHPRLEVPMSPVDLCYFIAEHDDHHLARITELLEEME